MTRIELADRINLLEEKRCVKCPAYYYSRGAEDWNEGCRFYHDFGDGLCWRAFLPRIIVKALLRRKEEREAIEYLAMWTEGED